MDIATINQRLSRVKIRQKGDRLYLRATLPNKDGSGKKQHELATGIPATDKGLKLALGKAQQLESDLVLEKFTWDNWRADTGAVVPNSCESWAIAFEKVFWESRARTPSRELIYHQDYGIAFSHLPADEPLTATTIKKHLLTTEPGTRSRERNWNAYSALARFAGVELPRDWKQLKGNYQPQPRRIPSDQEILDVWDRLTPGRWRWAYGMIAAYGIRNHEIVRLHLDNFPVIGVTENTKTKARLVYPLHKDWPERMELGKFDPPQLTSDINRKNGHRASVAFRRLGIDFSPYCLRDAYALRSARLGISPAIAAKWMGHSLTVHYKSYLRHIEQIDFAAVWEGLGTN